MLSVPSWQVQPLTIVGVTGLINLFNYTTYDILNNRADYLQFQAWVLMWVFLLREPKVPSCEPDPCYWWL